MFRIFHYPPSLPTAIAYQGHPAADDPRWRESGAPDQEAYGRWCSRLCGMACLRMALIARDGQAPALFTLLDGCLEAGGYAERPDGSVAGLLYRQFSEFARDRYQLRADVITDLDPSRMIRELGQGRLLMASVHKEIRRPDREPPGTGGHLVLVTGHHDNQVTFHNPSGHAPQAGIATAALALLRSSAAVVDAGWPGAQRTHIEITTRWPAYALSGDSALRGALLGAASAAGLKTTAKVAGPSNIGNYLAGLGIPATAGFGVDYRGLHGTDERIRLESVPQVQASTTGLFLPWCTPPD
ncbi:MAG: C39 family peptidase [Streptosporangiaceae bacterium]